MALFPNRASAQIERTQGIIDENVLISGRIESATLLVALSKGEFKEYSAQILSLGDSILADAGATDFQYLLAARVNLKGVKEEELIYSAFLLRDTEGQMSATPVKVLTLKQLQGSTLSIEQLNTKTEEISAELPKQRNLNNGFEQQLSDMRSKASKLAGVEDIIDLKSELDSLKTTYARHIADKDYLQDLLQRGRKDLGQNLNRENLRDNLDTQRLELLDQLKLAAEVTAQSEQVSSSKKASAHASYEQKVELIEETRNENLQELAKQVLSIKKQRQDLESNQAPPSTAPEF